MPTTRRTAKARAIEVKRGLRACQWLAYARADQAERLRKTRQLFELPVTIVDPHTHSEYSDGSATIAMNRDAAAEAGIDLIFATDHYTLAQKRAVRGMESVSWGQEPGAGPHHIGLLCNRRRFKPRLDSLDLDFERARRLAPFVWIPHPAGWYPRKFYDTAQSDALWTLGPAFAMEIINGAHKLGRAFDSFDEAAVELWDRLLNDGIRVTPLGASDAHIPESIGCCWTAMPARTTPAAVIETLNAGFCMASEAGMTAFRIKDAAMGGTLPARRGRKLTLKYRAADSAGLQEVRIIVGGRVRKKIRPCGAVRIDGEWSFVFTGERYARLEGRSTDDRRFFSAPIYLVAAGGRIPMRRTRRNA